MAGARVLERVRQALLDDPVRGEVDRGRQRRGLALDVELDRQARAADLVQQRLDACRGPGWGASSISSPSWRIAPSRRRISASAVRPACSTSWSASRSGASASGSRCRTAPTWSTITLTAWATMSCSSRAIRARSSATAMRLAGVPLALGLRRAHLRRLGLRGPLAQREAREPADREQGREEDELAGGVLGVVVDDDRRAADHDGQADPRLDVVAEVAQQQRRRPCRRR